MSADSTPVGTINNLKAYTDGVSGLPTGVTVKGQEASQGADAGYRQGTGTVGTTGTALAAAAVNVSSATSDATTFTFNTTAAHGLAVGDIVVVAGMTPAAYNGTWTVASVVDSDTFTVTNAANPGASSVNGTTTKLNHTGLTTTPVDIFTFTSGSPKSLAGSISNPSTGDWGSFLVFQEELATTAVPSTPATEGWTLAYDES